MPTETKTLTGYQAWKRANARVPGAIKNPQMVYNYMRNKMIPTVLHEDQVVIREEDFDAWFAKYMDKKSARAAAEA
jgi:preprotein translocase subunit SecB